MESKYKQRLIDKYGFEEGTKKYDNWYSKICLVRKNQYNIDWYIDKYGEVEGKKKLEEFKNKTSGSKKRYIKKYGKINGIKKFEEFSKKCSIYNSKYRIDKFGIDKYNESLKKYKNRINNTDLNYWLQQTDGNYIEAIKLFKDRQTTSTLKKFINRYGKEGENKWKECILKKIIHFTGTSKIEKIFSELLYKEIKNQFKEIYYYKNPYMFFTTKEVRNKFKKNVYIPDFFIKDINLIIEFYGDYWHGNPTVYNKNDIILGVLAEDIWKNDNERLMFLKKHYKVDLIIIWESNFRKNKEKVLKEIMEIINERKSKVTDKIQN